MFSQMLDLMTLQAFSNLNESMILTIKGENVIFFPQDTGVSYSCLKRKMQDFHSSSHGVFAQVQLFPLEAADGTFQPLGCFSEQTSCRKKTHIS